MINVEQAVTSKFPGFANKPSLIRKPTLSILRKLLHESQINHFLEENRDAKDWEFIDRVFARLNFDYTVSHNDRANIPAIGRVVIFANHPIGSLDGLAILKLVREVRPDVKIVANDMLSHVKPLENLFIPLDNMTGGSARRCYKQIIESLQNEEAIIVFPAGEVSRAKPTGVKDSRWLPGFLHFARRGDAPILPIHIKAKNSLLFYGASLIFKPLGTAMLAHEMFKQHSRIIHFSVGKMIPRSALDSQNLHDRTLVKRLKKHLYKIGRRGQPIFETETTIAPPEKVSDLLEELNSGKLIGETRDGNNIYLFDYHENSAIVREIGRLRELSFRKAGEGSGKARDLDDYDKYYRHLVLWNTHNNEIAGAYRLGEGSTILRSHGEKGFYTSTLYEFEPGFQHYLQQCVELGRSFVNPKYWGKACLDYLWLGIGSYLYHNPHIRYLIGPVSMSADYPKPLKDMLAYYYHRYHPSPEHLASAYQPYVLDDSTIVELDKLFGERDRYDGFDFMQQQFKQLGHKIPVLFKQYSALFEEGGFTNIVFSVDPDFNDCIDGLCMADMTKLKASKKNRYVQQSQLS